MKKNLKYKLILLFLAINVLIISSVSLYVYIDLKHDEKNVLIEKENQELEVALLKATLLLDNYHKGIFQGEYVDPQSYLEMVRELTLFAKGSILGSIRSYIRKDDRFILTATSATIEEFRAKRYPCYGESAAGMEEMLEQMCKREDLKVLHEQKRIAMSLGRGNRKFIVVADVVKTPPPVKMHYLSMLLLIAGVLVAAIAVLLRYIIVPLLSQIVEINTVLGKLFGYVLNPKHKESVSYINNVTQDEFVTLSATINTNIEKIIKKIEQDKEDLIRDNELADELTTLLQKVSEGICDERVQNTAHNKHLNLLRDQYNDTVALLEKALGDIGNVAKEYSQRNYIPVIEEEYRGKLGQIAENLNTISQNHSRFLLDQFRYLSDIDETIDMIDSYTQQNGYSLDQILESIKKASSFMKDDTKYLFDLDSTIKVVKQENSYIGELLRDFGRKYIESITLVTDFKNGLFAGNPALLLERFGTIIDDSSVRDAKVQEELTAKVREITSGDLTDISGHDMERLFKLLIEELLKDIQYSLHLIETALERLSTYSASRVSSFISLQNLTRTSHTTILDEIQNADKVRKTVRSMSNRANDMKYEIVDENRFIGMDEAQTMIDEAKEQ